MRLSALPRFRRHRVIITVYPNFPTVHTGTFANYGELEIPEYCPIWPLHPCYDSDFDSQAGDTNVETLSPGNNVLAPLNRDPTRLFAIPSCWLALLVFMLLCKIGSAQSSQETQFLPEIDAYLKLNPKIRGELSGEGHKGRRRSHSGRDRPQYPDLRETSDQAQGNHRLRSERCQRAATCPRSRLPLPLGP